jgi:hypothetical protein
LGWCEKSNKTPEIGAQSPEESPEVKTAAPVNETDGSPWARSRKLGDMLCRAAIYSLDI